MQEKKLKKGKKTGNGSIFARYPAAGILVPVLCAATAVLIIILLCIETASGNKLEITNKSSHKVTSLELWYEDEDSRITDVLSYSEIESGGRLVQSILPLGLSKLRQQVFLTVRFRFEDGGGALVQTSQNLVDFKGRIQIEFSDTSGEEVMIRMKAGEGLFNSSAVTGCDDYYYVNPKNGYIE